MMRGLPLRMSDACLYASNCSSSVGRAFLSMNRNSVRNRPTPSPSASTALVASLGVPMLQNSSYSVPSALSVFLPRRFSSSRLSRMNASRLAPYSSSAASSGAVMTSPRFPSTITSSPLESAETAPGTLSTAGISSARARIAE